MKYSRIISFLTALLCLAGASSCGKNENSENNSEPKGTDTSEVVIADGSKIITEISSGSNQNQQQLLLPTKRQLSSRHH